MVDEFVHTLRCLVKIGSRSSIINTTVLNLWESSWEEKGNCFAALLLAHFPVGWTYFAQVFLRLLFSCSGCLMKIN